MAQRVKQQTENKYFYDRTLATITPEDFYIAFENNSDNGRKPLPGLELLSCLSLVEIEGEQLAERDESWARTIQIYKQKCQVSIVSGSIRKDPKLAFEYYKLEYGSEMSLSEKREFINEENNS